MGLIRICSGFPVDWPAGFRDRFLDSFATHWPIAIELAADTLAAGGLDHGRLTVPNTEAAEMADGDLIAWLDPDIETTSAVPSYVIPQLIKDADLCFIGREPGDTDLGFWAARLSGPVREFLAELATSALAGQSAAEAWADARSLIELAERDLTPGRGGDNWALGPLGRYTVRLPHSA